jgi:hypothetical protein
MIPEVAETQDRVVKCIFCAQPIPLSPRLVSLYVVAKDDAQRAEQERRSRVVLLRCDKCSREAQYRRADIVSLGGGNTTQVGDTTKPPVPLNALRKAAS